MPVVSRSPRSYHEIGTRISRYIESEGLEPGTRLPGEMDLAKICGVSRPSLRRALVALEVKGLLEIRLGSGAYVCEPTPISPNLHVGPSLLEILRARILIEGTTASFAAAFASTTDLHKLERALQRMKQSAHNKSQALSLDHDFHVEIAEISKNEVLTSIVSGLWKEMFAPKHSQLCYQAQLEQAHNNVHFDHESVFAAILGRDPQQARLAMKSHLQCFESSLPREN